MLRLYFLGMPRIKRDDRPVELPAKAVALLAYLADTAGPVPRDRILGLLWGESAEDAARKNLRNTLWTIRRGLGDSVVRAEGGPADVERRCLGRQPRLAASRCLVRDCTGPVPRPLP